MVKCHMGGGSEKYQKSVTYYLNGPLSHLQNTSDFDKIELENSGKLVSRKKSSAFKEID